jgi:hypothetical protein
MTAAERQRKCRAGGKGRHRGGVTRKQMTNVRRRLTAELQAVVAAALAERAAAAEAAVVGGQPADPTGPTLQPDASPLAA